MHLRPATMLDAPLLYRWRMDESTRMNSTTTTRFSGTSHMGWLVERLASDDPLFIGEDLRPVGTIGFTLLRSGHWSVGITVDPDQRNRGWGTQLLRRGIALHPGIDYDAVIYHHNKVSQKLFESFGFMLEDENIVVKQYSYRKPTS